MKQPTKEGQMVVARDDVETWAEKYRTAWVTADSDAASVLFTEAATYRANIYEAAHQGRSGVKSYWESVTSVQSDVGVRMGTPVVDGESATVEFWTTMAVDGAPITLAGCLLLTFDASGLCNSLREYWNIEPGTHQPPMSWGE